MQRALRLEFEEVGEAIDKRATQGKVTVVGVRGQGGDLRCGLNIFRKTVSWESTIQTNLFSKKPGQRENSKLMSM